MTIARGSDKAARAAKSPKAKSIKLLVGSERVQKGPDGRRPFGDTSRTEHVYLQICQAIREGQFRQGDRIREDEVAQALGVSRTPVREALLRLRSRGLIEFSAGRGASVITLSRAQVLELYAMREVLEGAAARMAAEHATPAEISYLGFVLDQFDQSEGPERLAVVNARFSPPRSATVPSCNQYMLPRMPETKLRDTSGLASGDHFSPSRDVRPSLRGRTSHDLRSHQANRDPDAAEQAARNRISGNARVARMQTLLPDLIPRRVTSMAHIALRADQHSALPHLRTAAMIFSSDGRPG